MSKACWNGDSAPPVAIMIAALAIAPGHGLTQGFVWPTLLFYLLVDVTFGVSAHLTDSILPGMVVHSVGILIFFVFIWPHDATRRSVGKAARTDGSGATSRKRSSSPC